MMTELMCLPVAVAVVYVLASTPLLKAADKPPTLAVARSSALDGLRGVLALAVVFYHGYLTERFLSEGVWRVPASRVFSHLGSGAVGLFFMITGYLFWGKMLRDRGRPDWQALYLGRLFRIGPVYLCAISLMLIDVGFRTDWQLHVTGRHLIHEIAVWLPLGAQAAAPNVNGLPHTFLLTAGVTWSLRYEWGFYASLAVLAVIARLASRHALVVIGAALLLSLVWAALVPGDASPFPSWPATVALFLSGMFVASLPRLPSDGWRSSLLTAVVIVAIATSFVTSGAFSAFSIVCLGVAFYAIVSGCSVFGLLTTSAARRIGDVSYPLYLLHGLVLSTFAALVPPVSAPVFWIALTGAAFVAVMLATTAHVLVERPGVEFGRRISRAVTRAAPRGATASTETR
jgi:peptidoglycan/LPS O-acetylase OafA/YrhL